MSESLKLVKRKGITFLTFPLWENNTQVSLGFSTRLTGVSSGPFASLNLGLKSGDDIEKVRENRRRFLALWGKREEDLVFGEQVHGSDVVEVNRSVQHYAVPPAADGFITARKDVLLGAFSADCVLAFFYEPRLPAVGIAHAGWRGTLQGIFFKVIDKMEEIYSINREEVQVVLAPSIGPCCYEVGPSVVELFPSSSHHQDVVFYAGKKKDYGYFDLRETNRNVLLKAGVKRDNILVSGYCTCCNPQIFYSYRRSLGKDAGSMMGIIFLDSRKTAL